MTKTKVIAVRHGETQWNLEGRFQGQLDSPLTKNGLSQAKAVAKTLSTHNVSLIYSSDLGRALQTAEQISEATDIDILTDNRLRERHFGIFQGMTESDMRASMPDEINNPKHRDPDYIIPEGESMRQASQRGVSCISEIVQNHPGETIVVVTHGGILESFFRYVIGIPFEAPRMYKIWNTGLNIFSHSNGRWELLTFGNISHLQAI